MSSRDPDRLHEHEKPRAPEPKPQRGGSAAPLHNLVSNVGNRAFGGAIARTQGAGIMPGGQVHPTVQSKIDSTRGSGSEPRLGRRQQALAVARRPVGCPRAYRHYANDLNHAVSAKAFATGTDVYFAKDQYKPNTSDGDKLIAHELAHVVQQRGAPTSGPLTVSNPGDAMENEADAVADKVHSDRMPSDSAISFGFIDRRVMAAVERVAGSDPDPGDPFRGLYISDEVALRLSQGDSALDADGRLQAVVDALGLDLLEAAVLAVCAATELNPRYGRLYAYLQDDVTRKLPSPRLVGQLLEGEGLTPADVMVAFDAHGRLRHLGALKLLGDAQTPLAERPIKVADRLAAALLGGRMDESAAADAAADGRAARARSRARRAPSRRWRRCSPRPRICRSCSPAPTPTR